MRLIDIIFFLAIMAVVGFAIFGKWGALTLVIAGIIWIGLVYISVKFK